MNIPMKMKKLYNEKQDEREGNKMHGITLTKAPADWEILQQEKTLTEPYR